MMVGGEADAVAEIRPVLDTFALVEHVGPVGSGQVLELLDNLLFTAQPAVLADAVEPAVGLGLDVGPAMRAVAASTGGSRATAMFVDGGAQEVFPGHQDGRTRGAGLLGKDNGLARAVIAERALSAPESLDRLAETGMRLAIDAGDREDRAAPDGVQG